jgi:hypothetical protein
MNPSVLTQLAHADPNAAPLNLNEMIDIFNPLFSSVIQGSYIPYVINNSTPSVDDHDKAWIETDSAGRPLSIRIFYGGSWRRIYNGMLGEIRMFSGSPLITTDWDSNGHGVVGGTYDGWQICNGNNNSPDLSDKFIVGAHMNALAIGYPSGGPWKTNVDGTAKQSGGSSTITLDGPHTWQAGHGAVKVGQWTATGNTAGTSLYGLTHGDGTDLTLLASDPGNQNPTPIPTLPPYYALAFIIFQGYS